MQWPRHRQAECVEPVIREMSVGATMPEAVRGTACVSDAASLAVAVSVPVVLGAPVVLG